MPLTVSLGISDKTISLFGLKERRAYSLPGNADSSIFTVERTMASQPLLRQPEWSKSKNFIRYEFLSFISF